MTGEPCPGTKGEPQQKVTWCGMEAQKQPQTLRGPGSRANPANPATAWLWQGHELLCLSFSIYKMGGLVTGLPASSGVDL